MCGELSARWSRVSSGWCLLVFLLFQCQPEQPQTLFTRLTADQTHLSFRNDLKEDKQFNIIEYLYYYNGGGVAAGDVNNDGLIDIYFSSNQGPNKLYLNKGSFEFEDITETSGTAGIGNWKTGVTMADINGDGYIDIYVCGVGGYKAFNSQNQLLINNGNNTFTDRTVEYGLDFRGFGTQAAFFDFDLDGDLDCYLLNHSVHSTRTIGNISDRMRSDSLAGDRLLRNELVSNGINTGKPYFSNVTKAAGIFDSRLGYGLGLSVADLNMDGYPDIYVSNDFHENDYLYLNQKDGTFRQRFEKSAGHSSRFSMGNDVGDINNDGLPDIITLDMMPRDENIIKTSAGDDPFEIYRFKLSNGFYFQTARNCLQLNRMVSDTSVNFSDIAVQAGVEATDWSWSPLFADFDNDGQKDLFIANGILRRPNDMDYISFISNESVQKDLQEYSQSDLEVIQKMPSGKVSNYAFRNQDGLTFSDQTEAWGLKRLSLSNGASYADLDNDGDLDLVINNLNDEPLVYRNNGSPNSYLKIIPKGALANTHGLGMKAFAWAGGKKLYYEVTASRAFCSSVDTRLNIGLGDSDKVDSLLVVWPSGKFQRWTDVPSNQTLEVKEVESGGHYKYFPATGIGTILDTWKGREISLFRHREDDYNSFNRENLMPQMLTTEGPPLAVADVNGDGLDDVFVGGGKGQPGHLFLQNADTQYKISYQQALDADSAAEDVDAAFFDADGDGDNDLVVVSGGQEIDERHLNLKPRLYFNNGKGVFQNANGFDGLSTNASCVKPCDFDKDGDVDFFIGSSAMPLLYGMSPSSYLLENLGGGKFNPIANWSGKSRFPNMPQGRPGMVKDAVWTDVNRDGLQDLILVGEWMPVTVMIQNASHRFSNETDAFGMGQSRGWWNTIHAADVDQDGDEDWIVGNLGLNSRLKATPQKPLRMLLGDLDSNGSSDQILLYYNGEKSYPFASHDQLLKQLPHLKKKFLKYIDYRNVTVQDIVSVAQKEQTTELSIQELRTSWIRNDGDHATLIPLPDEAQFSPVEAIEAADVNGDGHLDLLMAGNFTAVQTELGPYDAGLGTLLLGDGKGGWESTGPMVSGFVVNGEARDIKAIRTAKGEKILLVSRNNNSILGFKIKKQK